MPTESPSGWPSSLPSGSPSGSPTPPPTPNPTAAPTMSPTLSPTAAPTISPTSAPTPYPTTSNTPGPTTPFPSSLPTASTINFVSGNTWSKRGNRRTCAWNECPSQNFWWDIPCGCVNGLDACYLDGPAHTEDYFDEADLVPAGVDGVWQMQASGSALNLGEGKDCASGGGDCIDDPLRGGFRVDLEGTPFEFTTCTFVNMYGWSSIMRVTTEDGMLAEEHVGAAPAENVDVVIPSGTKMIEVICGGWCGGCTSELYVALPQQKYLFFLYSFR